MTIIREFRYASHGSRFPLSAPLALLWLFFQTNTYGLDARRAALALPRLRQSRLPLYSTPARPRHDVDTPAMPIYFSAVKFLFRAAASAVARLSRLHAFLFFRREVTAMFAFRITAARGALHVTRSKALFSFYRAASRYYRYMLPRLFCASAASIICLMAFY